MTLTADRFPEFFRALWKYDPFPWQGRLAGDVAEGRWPDCIDLPTASGKTSVIDIAVFTLASQAYRPLSERNAGRRLFFAVNRRVIVDEAFERARKIAEMLVRAEADSDAGVLREVAAALRSLNEEADLSKAPPLAIAQLRGGVFRDRDWARSLTQPMVVCTTADQLGSRLLFRGYGVSPSMQPIHAALTACDSLVLLDEAHVTRAFCETMQLLPRYQQMGSGQEGIAPSMRFIQMTATPTGAVVSRFCLDDADKKNPTLKQRQDASKPAVLVPVGKRGKIDQVIANLAITSGTDSALAEGRLALGIIVNRVQTARDIAARLQKETPEADVHLVIGRMRPLDRDALQRDLRGLVGPEPPDTFPESQKPIIVVATQCLEVGADYDFDALISECASIDALRQRFGRLNRKGRPITAKAWIVAPEESLKGEDPVYGDAIKHTWEWLQSIARDQGVIDFGITAFKPLWDKVEQDHATFLDEAAPRRLLSPAPHAAVLLPAHLDALCQTSPQPLPSPDVSYFIHGPQRDMAEVSVCWRADLDAADDRLAIDAIRLLPPSSPECMPVPIGALRKWMGDPLETFSDADAPAAPTNPKVKPRDEPHQLKRVFVWRGAQDCFRPEKLGDLRPGDTVVIRTQYEGWNELGHIPTPPTGDSVDIAEQATREARLRIVLRLHGTFPGRESLRGLPIPELRAALETHVKEKIPDTEARERLLKVIRESRIDRHYYQSPDDDGPGSRDEVLVFRTPIEPPNRLDLPDLLDAEDDQDGLNQLNRLVSLRQHTDDVADRLGLAISRLGIESGTLLKAAEWHDLGKADARFQAMLMGVTPYEAMERPTLLGKGDGIRRTRSEQSAIYQRAMIPDGFRHEMLSVEIIHHLGLTDDHDRDLLLHLIAAHHGHARPFAPVCIDDPPDPELLSLEIEGLRVTGTQRLGWLPAHRLDSGVAERFWDLTRKHGWWGLAYLESILRLADQHASAAEQAAETTTETRR